jgi:membrane-associated phospholipid phosphatase
MVTPDGALALFTRLGEAQILLPAMAAALVWLALAPRTRPLATAWLGATAAAVLLTTATKVAFIGFEVGYAPLDYTGVSGHAMFAAVVLPVLARIGAGRSPRPWPRVAIAAGYVLAAGIAFSRVETRAHSISEAVLGFVIGGLASALALRGTQAPEAPTPAWLGAALVAWLLLLPAGAPPSRTHDWVTTLSLRASGRPLPYTRSAMHRQAWLRQRAAALLHGAASDRGAPAAQLQVEPVDDRHPAGDGVG